MTRQTVPSDLPDESKNVLKAKMKLAYITTIPITQWKFLDGQNAYMSSHGFELYCISSPTGYVDISKLAERDGAITYAVNIPRTISPFADIAALIRLVFILRKIKPQIVHVSTPKAALIGSIAAWLTRVPIRLFFIRGLATESAQGFRKVMFRTLETITARLSNSYVSTSKSLLAYARAEKILKPDQGIILAGGMSNGIDVAQFNRDNISLAPLSEIDPSFLAEDAFVIGYVGRLATDKGILELVDAWRILREEYPHLRLLCVGPFEDNDAIPEDYRSFMENDPRIHLTGYVQDVKPYYRLMSLFVLPSHYGEGFPNAPMEAAAMSLPVITTTALGCIDSVEAGVTGTIIPPQNKQALVDAVRQYLNDKNLRVQQGIAGRKRIEQEFRRELIWKALYDEYMTLLKAKRLI